MRKPKQNRLFATEESKELDPRNKLNDLSGKEWLKFTKSWFIFDALASDLKEEEKATKETKQHPATFSPTLIEEFIRFFTKGGGVVLDPFVGIGSTLVACDRQGREGIGIELNEKFAQIAMSRTSQKVITGDSTKIREMSLPKIDFCITSPPYCNMLTKIDVTQKRRISKNLQTKYSDYAADLGNIGDYDTFLNSLSQIFFDIYDLTKENGYLVIIIQNFREKDDMIPLAWDLTAKLSKKWVFKGERLWLQNHKSLHPFGYPFDYVSNVHHHYCLIFKKMNNRNETIK